MRREGGVDLGTGSGVDGWIEDTWNINALWPSDPASAMKFLLRD